MPRGCPVPSEALATLRRRLAALPARHPERKLLMASTTQLYAVSRATLYRLLRPDRRPKDVARSDRGRARVMATDELERLCTIVAAMKLRTTNRKGRHLSTNRILELLEKHGVETPEGFVWLEPGRLTASTVNRHLRQLGYDHCRLVREPPAVHFQAEYSNAIWHFDMSPSDLKQLKTPPWIDPDRHGAPTLMLFSVVDDRSGVAYQEYRCVYGEDAEAALKFLFNAMAAKPDETQTFQGIPVTLYLDNGPVAKSAVFKRVMDSLGVEVVPYMPAGSDGTRTTARSKGKVERPFRTVKEAHETLYHFHEPETEAEANLWLARYITTYNADDHRSEPHSRLYDWLTHLPVEGVRQMCCWERYWVSAREPERRQVGIDCRLTVAGVTYEVDPELAEETVVVWWGLFDQELWVKSGEERYGPYQPIGGSIPLHRYRKHRKSRREDRTDKIALLADKLMLPRAAVTGEYGVIMSRPSTTVATRPFQGPDPFHEIAFVNALAARRAIASEVRLPLAKLSDDDRAFIDALLARTLVRAEILAAVRDRFPPGRRGAAN
ncbi:IS481 family transposase [Brucella gallinifaecis]|uniref:IS481 family transposase n=1 Tax=Brucella gallinifaecis TaxID=215590 RepID=UPI00235FACF2|nr:IS481 family transposase [Brucella gallinifaecis]